METRRIGEHPALEDLARPDGGAGLNAGVRRDGQIGRGLRLGIPAAARGARLHLEDQIPVSDLPADRRLERHGFRRDLVQHAQDRSGRPDRRRRSWRRHRLYRSRNCVLRGVPANRRYGWQRGRLFINCRRALGLTGGAWSRWTSCWGRKSRRATGAVSLLGETRSGNDPKRGSGGRDACETDYSGDQGS